jgi:C_GCAxxG_C_C family probable redox protein
MDDSASNKALALHASGSNCAQSVLGAFAGAIGFDPAIAHRLTTGMGAGLGRKQLLCGAISGGAMAIGAAIGNDSGADLAAKERCYEAVLGFVNAMEAEFGAADCGTLLGVDLKTDVGKAQFKERGLGSKVCDAMISRAAELASETILKYDPHYM